ncbi:alpha/beta hydrolase [Paucibacter sp. PLA-PC-4]|uniref:alpha/beta fold hydrolase n=1 Tax=Paucibacter sp. PLA-PC-4 TaxID=2993655 RepID=UPI002248D5B2|nr:alpha/beta hydrolase [Paucibacter sp. PLA-PC-4]MCX2861980.1 alpha/beta hydrolase [Paucibacter sp. PLA-PC-4]
MNSLESEAQSSLNPHQHPAPTFVLLHGAWHGGWCYSRVARILRAKGYDVFTPTFTGLGERSHLASPAINSSTHVQDVLKVVAFEGLEDIVLVGHSYAGMIITAVADAIPEKIRALVYLDAFVGEHGKSLFDMDSPEATAAYIDLAQSNGGHTVPPLPSAVFGVNAADQAWVDSRCTPGSLACWTERLQLTGNHAHVTNRSYVFAAGWTGPFRPIYERVVAEGGWRTFELDCGHDVMVDMPQETADIIESAAFAELAGA